MGSGGCNSKLQEPWHITRTVEKSRRRSGCPEDKRSLVLELLECVFGDSPRSSRGATYRVLIVRLRGGGGS